MNKQKKQIEMAQSFCGYGPLLCKNFCYIECEICPDIIKNACVKNQKNADWVLSEARQEAAEEYLANLRFLPTQPAPIANDNPHIADLVMADILKRKQKGIETYGVPLQAHNGRDALQDAYEEALDLCCYLRQAMEERR